MKGAQNSRAYVDCLGMCTVVRGAFNFSKAPTGDVMEAVTGHPFTPKLMEIANRIYSMERVILNREGIRRKDDLMPERITKEAIASGSTKDRTLFRRRSPDFQAAYEQRYASKCGRFRLPPGACRTFVGAQIPAGLSAFPRKRELSEVGLSPTPIPDQRAPWQAPAISERSVNVDRQTPLLLPVDLRDRVPADDLVHFIINAMETMDTPALSVNRRGTGDERGRDAREGQRLQAQERTLRSGWGTGAGAAEGGAKRQRAVGGGAVVATADRPA